MKSEPHSQPLKEIFVTIVRTLKEDSSSLKAVQKFLINSVGERDFSAQETCHLLLQLLMFKTSRDFVVLSLDGSRAVGEHLDEDQTSYSAVSSRPLCLSACDCPVSEHDTAQLHPAVHYAQGV